MSIFRKPVVGFVNKMFNRTKFVTTMRRQNQGQYRPIKVINLHFPDYSVVFRTVCLVGDFLFGLGSHGMHHHKTHHHLGEGCFWNFFQASSRRNCWSKVFLSWRVVSNNVCLFYFHTGFAGENESIFGVCRVLLKVGEKTHFPSSFLNLWNAHPHLVEFIIINQKNIP